MRIPAFDSVAAACIVVRHHSPLTVVVANLWCVTDIHACLRSGRSALCLAVEAGKLDVVSLLVSRGADSKFKVVMMTFVYG